MARETILAIALAMLVSLGGCSGLFPNSGPDEASPTPFGPRSYDQAVENHTGALLEAGQFKLRWVRTTEYPNRTGNSPPITEEFVADIESQQFLVGDELDGHNGVYQSGAWYQSASTMWERVELDNGSLVYRRLPPDAPLTARNYTMSQVRSMAAYSKQFPLERNGTAIFQGQRVTRYTTDDLGPAERCLRISSEVIETVTSASVVALVDRRGIIRKFECRLSGETVTDEAYNERVVMTVTGVGTVEIREPSPLTNQTVG
jgi:hypothetical protein